ncbi:Leucine-rich repeat [Sesbania bispinosa]|nr:Leucine-rich repeat [Sesbania bispinosa]
MEVPPEQSGEEVKPEKPRVPEKKNIPEGAKGTTKTAVNSGASVSARKKVEPRNGSDSGSSTKRSGSIGGSVSAVRRNSTGGLLQKPSISDGRKKTSAESAARAKSSASSVTEPVRRSLPELRRSSITSARAGLADKPVAASPVGPGSRTSAATGASKVEVAKKPLSKPSLSTSAFSSSRRIGSSVVDSSGGGGSARKTVSKVSSPSSSSLRSPTVSSGLRTGSLSSSTSKDRSSTTMSGRRKVATPDSRDSRFIVLPQIEIKANDDVRLDLRGHRVRSLNASGLNLSSNLEFVYLRDNLLSTLEGVEVLTRVKVLDLSFNDFKGPGFEPLENCKVLQQLYLAGNQITSLASLPQLPNLEASFKNPFLSVAQNKLKSLAMASQPRLQVLAASKNKISTLKGFPYLPVLEHLRVEENPILKMPHLEAASILLVGPTLKRYNDRDLSREEIAIAKRYPAHSALCIRDGWEFSRPEHAAESTFHFLVEKWKDHIPPGFFLKEASIDKPLEEDVCRCHFTIINDGAVSADPPLVLKYQWFCGDITLSNFLPIPDATSEIYLPKHDDIGKVLKVECTPILGEIEYPPIFAISSRVSPGSGIPKVVNLEVHGELVEGSIIRGCAKVAWCGGTPGKGVASWLRRKWNSSPVVIVGAEDEEYQLTIDDVDSSLVFMYTPVTEEGAKGEPQYKYTDFVRAAPPSVSNVRIVGDAVEGNTIKGVGDYFGGREGPSKFEWLRKNRDVGDLLLVSAGTSEYTLAKEDVGCCLAFVYIPINFEGQEGKSLSVMSPVVKQAPPKVSNVKIIGDLRENSKITATGVVTGGTEGSSRVQWYKTCSSTLDENSLEALSTSKIAKAFRIPLGAVGYYIVAKFTPMTPDGDAGEPAFVISDRAVETLPPSLNFLSIMGDYCESGILTASYGYVGGHEGKSIYDWYIHEVEGDFGSLIPGVSGLLQYRITKEAIGKFISFQCTPVRDDGVVGDLRICMGQERVRPDHLPKTEWERLSTVQQTSSDGTQSEIMGANTASYVPSIDDIGFFLSVSCEPVRSDWARGPMVISEQIGPIIPGAPTCHSLEFLGSMIEGQRLNFNAVYSGGERGECTHEWFRVKDNGAREKISSFDFLDLTLDDVGTCIELIYMPVRKDGVKGSPKSIVSDLISPADPKGMELVIPECSEDREITPLRKYFGGHEGVGEYIWYQTKNKLEGSAVLDIPNASDVVICGTELTYKPSLEDIGAYLALYWVPTRADNKCGEPLIAICSTPVSPASPIVSNVHVKELSSGIYSGEGEYFGGYEGESLFSWYRENNEGIIELINGANSKTYEVTDSDYNCRLLFGYTPIRSDSVVGELRLSDPTDIVLPGKAVEGDILTAVEVIPNTESQQHVWSKYKKDIRYQCILNPHIPICHYSLCPICGRVLNWIAINFIGLVSWVSRGISSYVELFCTSEVGDSFTYEPLPNQTSCSYRVRLEDIGRRLKCECVVTDVFGRSGEVVYIETTPVLPGLGVVKSALCSATNEAKRRASLVAEHNADFTTPRPYSHGSNSNSPTVAPRFPFL